MNTNLTLRQVEVLTLLASGENTKSAAYRLAVSPKTVEYHWAQIKSKLRLTNYIQAAHYAIAKGLVPLMFSLALTCSGADRMLLGWKPADNSTTNFIVYSRTNNTMTWQRVAVVLSTNVAATTNRVYPTYYRVTAMTWDGDESAMSEQLAILARDTETTVYGQYGPTVTGPWTDYLTPIFRGTNVTGQKFFRTRATQRQIWRTMTTP